MHVSEKVVVVVFLGMLLVSLILLVRKKFKWGVILLLTALLYFDIALPAAKPARFVAQLNACNANLKLMNEAVEKWSKENNMAVGDSIDLVSVVSHLKGGKLPICPAGGFYKLSNVGTPVSCSLPEHANDMPSNKP